MIIWTFVYAVQACDLVFNNKNAYSQLFQRQLTYPCPWRGPLPVARLPDPGVEHFVQNGF